MKAVWKDETTHAESVYCMCSIPHTSIECYRHPTQPIVVFVLFGVYCAWSLLAFIHIFFAIGYAVQRTLVQTTAFVSILHSLLLWVRCCCCCQFVHIFRLGLFIFFAHACSQHCATILYLISMCMVFFPLSLSSFSSHYIRECEFHLWADVLKHTEKKSGNMVFRRNQKHKLFVSMCCSIVVCMCSCFETQSFFTSLSFYVCFVAVTMRSFLWCL